MSLIVKSFNDMVDDILDRIVAADIGFTDKTSGSILRTIVEAIVSEMDIMSYKTMYVYDSILVDNASGDDLDRVVAILAVSRLQASYCTGIATLSRSTAVTSDISIPAGSILSTKPDVNGNVYYFEIVTGAVLVAGQTSINVDIRGQSPGYMSLSTGQLCVISTSIPGIDTVTNASPISGGANIETDDALRSRAKLALSKIGKATGDALKGALLDISGVEQVTELDQHRGVGTSDLIVMCTANPAPQELQDTIADTIKKYKASGVDIQVIYPTINYVEVDMAVVLADGIALGSVDDGIGNIVINYGKSLTVGSTFVIKKMESLVLSGINSVLDMTTTLPASNITCTETQVNRVGKITINGEVWYDVNA